MSSELPLRILVVDCDEPLCAVTTEMLESLGHHAKRETDSLSALRLFSESPYEFDLAIVEPAMPDLMGLDLAVRLRRIRPGFPVLFYAGYADESLSSQIETNGLGRVAFKPFTLNELAAAITERLSPIPHRQPA
jgi:DNA-binding response OmpR family regulator